MLNVSSNDPWFERPGSALMWELLTSRRGRFSAGMRKGLVHDDPAAVDLGQIEEIDKRDGSPKAVLSHRGHRLSRHLNESLDRYVDPLAIDARRISSPRRRIQARLRHNNHLWTPTTWNAINAFRFWLSTSYA